MRKVTAAEMDERRLEYEYEAALSRIKEGHAAELAPVTERYSPAEREGWHELVKQAYSGEGRVIEKYAESMGVSKDDASKRVRDAAEKYDELYGSATGKLAKLRDEADTAYEEENIETLKSITW